MHGLDSLTFRLPLSEVADRLNVTEKTIRARLKRPGDHSPYAKKLGRKWWFTEAVFGSEIALSGK